MGDPGDLKGSPEHGTEQEQLTERHPEVASCSTELTERWLEVALCSAPFHRTHRAGAGGCVCLSVCSSVSPSVRIITKGATEDASC